MTAAGGAFQAGCLTSFKELQSVLGVDATPNLLMGTESQPTKVQKKSLGCVREKSLALEHIH